MYVFYIKMSSCQPTANSQNRWSTGPVAHLGAWLCRGILGITQKSAAFSGRCLWAWPHGRIRDFGWGTGRNWSIWLKQQDPSKCVCKRFCLTKVVDLWISNLNTNRICWQSPAEPQTGAVKLWYQLSTLGGGGEASSWGSQLGFWAYRHTPRYACNWFSRVNTQARNTLKSQGVLTSLKHVGSHQLLGMWCVERR